MATDTRATSTSASLDRITVGRYLEMIVSGAIPNDARVELLDGRLVEQMTSYPRHTFAMSESTERFRSIVPAALWVVREGKPVIMGRFWRPEPDVAIVRGPKARYRTVDPARADISLLVEVSDSTYASDRGQKWRAYAAARIPIYWIVNIDKNQIEVYANPAGRGKTASYRESTIFGADAEVPVVIDGQDYGRFAVKEILP